jgi:hypothetical protein
MVFGYSELMKWIYKTLKEWYKFLHGRLVFYRNLSVKNFTQLLKQMLTSKLKSGVRS